MGRHGSMRYLEDPRRADPHLVQSACQSILILGIPHQNPGGVDPGVENHLTGSVASYAWGLDYHLILPGRLEALVSFMESRLGRPIPHLCFTDSGPILEKDLAQRAGLGWIGKNTCLINPQIGSYFLLAEILLGIVLDPDPPFIADRCGTCTRCIQACPTGCIQPDRTLDARRCISYLTIENKITIPPELRPRLGNHVFGCDLCQQACPWNKFAQAEPDADFAARPGIPTPPLLEDLILDEGHFKAKFLNSAVLRSKRSGYLRNIAVACGNSGSTSALPALDTASRDPDPLVREHAQWAIEQIQHTRMLNAQNTDRHQ